MVLVNAAEAVVVDVGVDVVAGAAVVAEVDLWIEHATFIYVGSGSIRLETHWHAVDS